MSIVSEGISKIKLYSSFPWSKNTIFAAYSQKFRKLPISLKIPHGDNAADIAKMFAFFCKNRFSGRKTRFSQKSNRISAKFPKAFHKNRIPQKKKFPNFRKLFCCLPIFSKKLD
jgi:hypothetical protein